MPQEEFATFIEDNLTDIFAPEGSDLPPAAAMLEISRTLEATSSHTFSQRTNLKSGERKLAYNETLNATAGPGEEMSIPDKFIIKLPIFLNQFLPLLGGAVGVEISTAGISHSELIIFGALIVWFLIAEPHGLAKLWALSKQKLRLWPFPH